VAAAAAGVDWKNRLHARNPIGCGYSVGPLDFPGIFGAPKGRAFGALGVDWFVS
jgi:hypothetical protein